LLGGDKKIKQEYEDTLSTLSGDGTTVGSTLGEMFSRVNSRSN
jgi:hypothetical protein